MKWYRFILVMALIAGVGLYCGCGENTPEKIGYGTLEYGVYTNEYFGMRVEVPDGWHALDDESRKELMQKGKKMIAGGDKNLEAAIDASELDSVNLFTVYEHPPGTPVSYNPSLACVAEKVGHLPGIKRGSDYLFHMNQVLERSRMNIEITDDIYSEDIGGVSFDVQEMELNVSGFRIRQKYYAAIIKDYALGIVMSSTTDEEQEALEEILATMELKND
jgi:hypothetical protein